MPCYESVIKIVYPPGCAPIPFEIIESSRVHYDGPNLACTGIQTNDCLTDALQKIDEKICSDQFVAQIIQTIENNSVLKAYFCQLVSGCVPTTTSTSTTIVPITTSTTTVAPTTTSTSTTVNACPTPVINGVTTDGFGNTTINYSLRGSTGCTSVTAEYSDYSNFSPVSYGRTISNGCNLTTYVLSQSSTSTLYIRISTICNGVTLFSNIMSITPGNITTTTSTTTIAPTTTTTTTVNCLVGKTEVTLVNFLFDSGGSPFLIGPIPIGDVCLSLPTIQGGTSPTLLTAYVGSLSVGQLCIDSSCVKYDPQTYAVYTGSLATVTTFIAVNGSGIITSIVTCP